MLDFEKDAINDEAKRAAERELAQMISRIILQSNAPESHKASIRLLDAASNLDETVHKILSRDILTPEYIDVENAAKFATFLVTVSEQIKFFAINNPLIKKENNGNV
ncbi:MAG: hypothetical protein IKA62_06330 [Clostridia bacterium]|nr:hypothetical protein [Clostridia bacterium]